MILRSYATTTLHARRALHATTVALHEPRLLTRPKGFTRCEATLPIWKTLPAVRPYPSQRLLTRRQALHATQSLYTLHVLQHLTRRMPLHAALLPYSGKGHYSQRSCLTLRSTYNFNLNAPLRQPEHEETIIYRIIVMVEKYKVILN